MGLLTPHDWERGNNKVMSAEAEKLRGEIDKYVGRCVSKRKAACYCVLLKKASEYFHLSAELAGLYRDAFLHIPPMQRDGYDDYAVKVRLAVVELDEWRRKCSQMK